MVGRGGGDGVGGRRGAGERQLLATGQWTPCITKLMMYDINTCVLILCSHEGIHFVCVCVHVHTCASTCACVAYECVAWGLCHGRNTQHSR